MRILIVDDSAEQRQLLEVLLKAGGYTDLLTAESPPDAFKHDAISNPASSDPEVDLILMDIEMPDLDGLDACRQLKGIDHLRDIPILMVTSRTEESYLAEAFAAGATDYITKPVKKVAFLARVGSALALKREMDRRKARERELEQALREVKVLRGFIPICAGCKQIRNDQGFWQQVEVYIQDRSEALFSHSICPDCLKTHYKDYLDELHLGEATPGGDI